MIHFIDQTSEKNHHTVFNSSCIKILQIMYPNETITFHGILSNQQKTAELLSEIELKFVVFNSIPNPTVPFSNKFIKFLNLIKKEKIRYKLFEKILKTSSNSDLIFHSITTFTAFYGLKKLKLKFKVPVIAVLHGDLDFLFITTNMFEKIIGFVYKKNLSIKATNFYYLLLNKISKTPLIEAGYLNENEILEIDHPFNSLTSAVQSQIINQNTTITFGHIGSMEVYRKNSHLIYDLASRFPVQIKNCQIRFEVVGLVTKSVILYKNNFVNEISGNKDPNIPEYLSRTCYEAAINKLQYSLFFYNKSQYVFRASGAIADAISSSIPLIVLKHPIFEYIFKYAGNVGYICENLEQMEKLVKKISLKDPEIIKEHAVQVQNLKIFQTQISISNIGLDLKKQLINHLSSK